MGSNKAFSAECRDALEVHRALRARAEQLNITRLQIDEIAGLTPGYASKVLAAEPMISCVGAKTLGPLLGTLGLKLLVVEDDEALARVQHRFESRDLKRVRGNMLPRYRVTSDYANTGLGIWKKGQEFE